MTQEIQELIAMYLQPNSEIRAVEMNEICTKISEEIDTKLVGTDFLGSITPSSTPTGTGKAFWLATQAGTYTNFGGVVVATNSFAVISRNDAGVFSISQTALDISSKVNVSDIADNLTTDSATKVASARQAKLLNEKLAEKANLVVGKNIFNKATAIIGYTISQTTGALTSNAAYDTSDFIPIIVGQAYKSNSETRLTTYFDANKNVVSGGSGVGITSFTTPAGVAFIRISIAHTLLNTYQLEKGTVSTAFENYIKTVQSDEISNAIARKTDIPDVSKFPLLSLGKNLFNKNATDAVLGSYVNHLDGVVLANSSYNATGFIPILPSTNYAYSTRKSLAYYDLNKIFISGVANDFSNPLTSPSNAAYVRCSVITVNWNTFQVELGSVSTIYEAYINSISDSVIPNIIARKTDIPDVTKVPLMILGKNLYNQNDCAFSNAWGSANTAFNTTGFIDISGNEGKPLWTSDNGISVTIRQCQFYNSSKVLIGGMVEYPVSGQIIPTGAHYVRYAFNSTILKFQVELGLSVTAYEIYNNYLEDKNISSNIQRVTALASDMQLPSTLYLANQKMDLFFAPIVKNFFKKDKFVRLSATNAVLNRHFTKLATITPTSNGVATFSLYNDSFNLIGTKAVNTIITPITKTGNLKTMFVGSSITGGAKYIEYIKTICGAGVTFLGMRHASATGVQHEGRGGWGLNTYFQQSTSRTIAYNGFYHPENGRHWGSTAYWADVMNNPEFGAVNAGAYDQGGFKTAATNAGFLATGKIAGAKLLINDIMYDNALSSFIQWNGTVWNTISTPTTWGIDFVKYGAMWDILAPDLFFIAELATNDFRGSATDPIFTTWNAQIEKILTALKVWNASAKLALTINFSSLGGDHTGTEFQERNNYRMWQCRKNCITNFDNRVGEGIYLIDNGIGFDEDYGFDLSTDTNFTIPNALYTGSERLRVQSGNPHPNEDGNNLLGKCLVGIIQFLRT